MLCVITIKGNVQISGEVGLVGGVGGVNALCCRQEVYCLVKFFKPLKVLNVIFL